MRDTSRTARRWGLGLAIATAIGLAATLLPVRADVVTECRSRCSEAWWDCVRGGTTPVAQCSAERDRCWFVCDATGRPGGGGGGGGRTRCDRDCLTALDACQARGGANCDRDYRACKDRCP